MKLQIFIPHSAKLASEEKLSCAALSRLLAVGSKARHSETLDVMLCQMAGVVKQADWPIAPLRWLGEGGRPEDAYWLIADPVHFVLQRDSFSLEVPAPLSEADAQTLISALNEHFASEELQFTVADSGRWYLRLIENPEVSTTFLAMALGRDVSEYLPQGRGAAKWKRLQNEMQMLLHDHPVNLAREARGELPINSIWLSGGGALPAKFETGFKAIYTNNPLARGLSLASNSPSFPMPENLEAVTGHADEDVWLAPDYFADAESKWFAPVLSRLRQGKIKRLTLHFEVYEQTLSVDIRPQDLWKFWRKAKSLQAYLS